VKPRLPIDGLRRMARLLDPRVARRLVKAGFLERRSAVGAARAVPWLIGRGASLGLLAQINADAHPERPAVIDRHGTLSWAELDARVNQLAGALVDLGVRPRDRVATLLRNGREQAEVLTACQRLGIAVAPLNTWGKDAEVAHALEQTEAKAIVYDTRHAAQLRPSVNENDVLLAVKAKGGRAIAGSPDYEETLAARRARRPRPFTLARGQPKVIIHTSGTTGRAKAASRGTAGMWPMLGLLAVVPFTRDDVVAIPAPMFHSFGLLNLTLSMLLGCTMVLPDRFDPEETLALIQEHHATAAAFVPVMIRRILSLPKATIRRYDLSSLRIVLASGSAMSPEFRQDAMKVFGEVVYDLYGSTEAGWVAIATPEDMRADARTVGTPVPGVEVAVLSEEGEPLPPGEHGVISVRSDAAFEGYASGESTAEQAGYLSMGDLGWMDGEGRLYVEGRADDMVVVGGENVYPAEIEDVIQSVRGVREATVIGVDDPEYGQVLAAFVQGRVDPERVKSAAKARLASFKVPKIVKVVDEFPRTATGKVRRKDLEALLDGDVSEGAGRAAR
jgi:acyl-CoA synthetase (AMP-forming)/AMP-acid ligase II